MIRQSSQINVRIKTLYRPSFLKDVNQLPIYLASWRLSEAHSVLILVTEFAELAGCKIIALQALVQSNDDKDVNCESLCNNQFK